MIMKFIAFIIIVITLLKWEKLGTARKLLLAVIVVLLWNHGKDNDKNHQKIAFDKPAACWEETLPLGNGRLGMMPDGGVDKETIVLNDITYWSGWEADYSNPKALEALPEIRALLAEGKNYEAQNLMYETFTCGNNGSNYGNAANTSYGCYQTLGSLIINYYYDSKDSVFNYSRLLDLNNAIVKTEFKRGRVKYKREYFVSRKDDVALVNFEANAGGKISFTAELDLNKIENGVKLLSLVDVKHDGGTVNCFDNKVVVKNASKVLLIFSSATNFNNEDYERFVKDKLHYVKSHSYNKLRKNHLKSYKELYDRVSLTLDDDKRAELYFNYGRYLFISSTREDLLPPNLQGLWANTAQTSWNGDYHLNINLQMNHWLANVCNLPELNEPLINLTKGLMASGEKTARDFYGADGWVAHMMTNPWRFTAPGEHPSWGATNTGGAWLCQHLWRQYEYTQDVDYLKDIYPVMKGSAEFFHSMMMEEPTHGWLVTAPTSSPENAFYDADGHEIYVCMGSTMDVQIVTELYQNVIKASEVLHEDSEFAEVLKSDLLRFPPMHVSDSGYLLEWLEDYKEVDVHHRHVSHLFGLHPANLITKTKTPELYEACKVTLNRRGDGGTGWSKAWKVNFWARLHDGDRAYKLLNSLLDENTYPNMFCAHPPFQIDGNFGGATGIAEMLLQCNDGEIEVLPALPSAWKSGSFKGFCVVGGYTVDCEWENGEITYKKIHKPKK
ncbi:MAG: glycoside hydrolase family 95 protein [Bacteroidales bacterium]|nr:glycoside hydrolase family 95 protein [Bacteroidales bacterium]